MVYHSNQLLEAIIKLWQRGNILTQGLLTPLMTAIVETSKGTVAYQVKKFQEINSVETLKKNWTASICEDA